MSLRKSLLIFATAFSTLAACSAGPQKPPSLAATQSSNDVAAGRKLFAQNCASCHAADANGSTRAPSLQSPSVQSMPDADLAQFLADGRLRKGMPSWSQLPAERRWQLVRFIKSLPDSGETHGR